MIKFSIIIMRGSFGEHLVGVHYSFGVKDVFYFFVEMKSCRTFHEVEVLSFVESHSVLCTNAPPLLGYLLKKVAVIELLSLLKNDHEMKISISNVSET